MVTGAITEEKGIEREPLKGVSKDKITTNLIVKSERLLSLIHN